MLTCCLVLDIIAHVDEDEDFYGELGRDNETVVT